MSDPHGEKSESDVNQDNKVAGSRDGKSDGGGEYVGRTFEDESFDDEQSGAEARSNDS
ncbi:hypothetical protein LV457_19290 [Mycobacterium sp. MYCO198283]|uniref:hypothetical protein n=1 Tax=Mycobacterium sp. MYCO198283 TaxID=2883505 RepID=UPI001E5024F9|nr:hypothetical protein [Mycobacterium sp. MYCO198283]MCG5434421.1 hypothetical protein [Mycobacterium sp. MYCO198283]